MYKNKILNILVLISFLGAAWIPLHSKFYTTPAYSNLIAINTEKYLIKLASRMVKNQNLNFDLSSSSSLPKAFINEVEDVRQTVGLWKVKIFTPKGEIIYSSDSNDIGSYTRKDFFAELLKDGMPRTFIDEKYLALKNNEPSKSYMLETYVPITSGKKTIGAFEIYYDITDTHNSLAKIKSKEEKILFPVVFGLLLAVFLSAYYANKSMAELKLSKEKFKELSLSDGLTGLLNRRGFTNLVQKQLLIANRGDRYLFLIFIDLDNFKKINDTLGHEVGDEALVETANILNNTFRNSDIIGRVGTDIIGRLGGDEFAILTCQNKQLEAELAIRRRLEENIRLWNEEKGHRFKLSLSYGIASYSPETPCSLEELITKADNLMYESKQKKKNA